MHGLDAQRVGRLCVWTSACSDFNSTFDVQLETCSDGPLIEATRLVVPTLRTSFYERNIFFHLGLIIIRMPTQEKKFLIIRVHYETKVMKVKLIVNRIVILSEIKSESQNRENWKHFASSPFGRSVRDGESVSIEKSRRLTRSVKNASRLRMPTIVLVRHRKRRSTY